MFKARYLFIILLCTGTGLTVEKNKPLFNEKILLYGMYTSDQFTIRSNRILQANR